MLGIKVNIIHHISDEPQPGIVECELFDARGRRWSFVEKTAIVSLEDLRANTSYPRPGVIACEIVSRSVDQKGRDVVIIVRTDPGA